MGAYRVEGFDRVYRFYGLGIFLQCIEFSRCLCAHLIAKVSAAQCDHNDVGRQRNLNIMKNLTDDAFKQSEKMKTHKSTTRKLIKVQCQIKYSSLLIVLKKLSDGGDRPDRMLRELFLAKNRRKRRTARMERSEDNI